MRDLHNNIGLVRVLDPAVRNADVNGGDADVDLQGYNACQMVVVVGQSADTLNGSNTISLELEESDDDSTYTDVAAADMLGGVGGSSGQFALIDDPAEDDLVYSVGYIGDKRYVRLVVNFSGTHGTGTPIGAVAVVGHGRHKVGPAV